MAFLAVEGTNTAPDAQDDSFTVEADETVSGNFLTNDSDADGDPLSERHGARRSQFKGNL